MLNDKIHPFLPYSHVCSADNRQSRCWHRLPLKTVIHAQGEHFSDHENKPFIASMVKGDRGAVQVLSGTASQLFHKKS
ncbi:hypothetical protein C0557_11935 [Kosakonia sp. MUSA4]|nr:hypothetical protein C0557_11935 [Kosakonia sp. MUSA4]